MARDFNTMRRNQGGGHFGGRGSEPVPRKGGRPLRVWINRGVLLTLVALILFFGGRYWWREGRWRYIVIHHTASDIGNMEYYRKLHVEKRGWPDIAYHFLINNGSFNTGVGQVETSSLWTERRHNYSTKVSYVNYFGIAVALVGNFDKHPPPRLQREALILHVTRLARQYNIPPERIIGHREVWPTACPGKHLHLEEIRAAVARNLKR